MQDVGEPSRYKYEVQAHGFLRTIPNNKQDITYANGCCISGDRNVIKKEAKKILEHKDLTTVIISKSFRKYLIHIPGKHEIKKL